MRFFRDITTKSDTPISKNDAPSQENPPKNVIIMGRKTWESLPDKAKPLDNRINIVLSSNPKIISDYKDKTSDLYVCDSLDNSLEMIQKELANKAGNVFLIGGKKVYEEGFAHPKCNEIFLTRLGVDMECDTFMQQDFMKGFKHLETSRTYVENKIPFDFQHFVHKDRYKKNKQKLYFSQRHEEFQYLELLNKIITEGVQKDDRTGVGTISRFGEMMRFNLEDSFPLLTTKNVFWRGVIEELLWFVRGQTDSNILRDKGIHIWDGNTSREFLDKLGLHNREVGDIGPGYGFQWRHFGAEYTDSHADYTGQGVDQLMNIINTIKTDPGNRRMILSAWNPAALHLMALPPCHMMSQFYVADGKLSCMMYQRSCDIGLGVPFNIASYSLLLCMIAQVIYF